jgi:hypothetical protein
MFYKLAQTPVYTNTRRCGEYEEVHCIGDIVNGESIVSDTRDVGTSLEWARLTESVW